MKVTSYLVMLCLSAMWLGGCKKQQAKSNSRTVSSLRSLVLDDVPVTSGLSRASASDATGATKLDVSTDRVVAWARRHCDTRWFDSFDGRGRRDGHARFECGLGQWNGQEVLTVKVDIWNQSPSTGGRARRFIAQRFDYETRGAGRLLRQRDELGIGPRTVATLLKTASGWTLTRQHRQTQSPPKESRLELRSVRSTLRNGWLALAVLWTDGKAEVGDCYRMAEFSALKGKDRSELRKLMGQRQILIGGKRHRIARYSGLFLDNLSQSESLTDSLGNDLLITINQSTWRLGRPRGK